MPVSASALFILGALVLSSVQALSGETYRERLSLSQLPDGTVLGVFDFNRSFSPAVLSEAQANHYSLLPRAIGEIIQTFEVAELHLTFTQGRYNYRKWPMEPYAAPSGVELWAWFRTADTDARWKGLTNALSGLFCASLNFLDETLTTSPLHSYDPEGHHANASRADRPRSARPGNLELRHGILSNEITCTENLTPWAKLLPCQTKSGIASLLNAYKIYDTEYHSMSVHVQPQCQDAECRDWTLEVYQRLVVAVDPRRTVKQKDWSMYLLFGREIQNQCPLATDSTVSVQKNTHSEWFASSGLALPSSESNSLEVSLSSRQPGQIVNLGIKTPGGNLPYFSGLLPSASRIQAHRYLVGFGASQPGMATRLTNSDEKQSYRVVFFQTIPWYLKLYLHTLKVKTIVGSEQEGKQHQSTIYYQPSIDRVRPGILEIEVTLPPKTELLITVAFEYALVRYTEHPPDSERGFQLSSGTVSYVPARCEGACRWSRIYTEPLLLALPTPDFSMPYNVITFTCTVMALFFGSMFNALIRDFSAVKLTEKELAELKNGSDGQSRNWLKRLLWR
ncbi:GPI transamidase component PIG-T [Polychytrium aggregatum]|uniref:GPI transamidase component PIG-T n=1 Tax=Polychytrium aggregatum TaxID=110093 RepID=UPI0022FEB677|nr:GPI transamidase component PIG-T [Polychytrium aggregatum]KAI9209665.1 GPI transamidase component PIG-T [Polychytrium aggregatum]